MRSRGDMKLQAERAAVECINKRVKEWAVARTVWEGTRDPEEFFDSVMRVVCALTNVILCTHPLWASDHRRAHGRSVS